MFRPWASFVPTAIPALVSALQLDMAVSFPTVLVKDGMFISAETNSDIVVIGWSGFMPGYQYPSRSMSEQLLHPTVTSKGVLEGLGPSVREELEINCAAVTRVGSSDVVDARTRAYNHVAVVGRMIAPPLSTLAGFLARTTMAENLQLHQVQDRRGALAIVTFAIRGEAYSQQLCAQPCADTRNLIISAADCYHLAKWLGPRLRRGPEAGGPEVLWEEHRPVVPEVRDRVPSGPPWGHGSTRLCYGRRMKRAKRTSLRNALRLRVSRRVNWRRSITRRRCQGIFRGS